MIMIRINSNDDLPLNSQLMHTVEKLCSIKF